jgi:uncharacterized membrane protein (UPF0127 family)
VLRDAARHLVVFLVIVAAVALGALVLDEIANAGAPEQTSVTIVDRNGTERGTLDVRVAASFREQYVGLSRTDSLGPDEGMLFVYDRETNHSIVMRGMDFPIDVVFVGKDRRITRIYHAEVEEPPLTKYRGRSKWTIEAPYNWTVRNSVSVGDRVRIAWLDDS